jgi:hypothetical protein
MARAETYEAVPVSSTFGAMALAGVMETTVSPGDTVEETGVIWETAWIDLGGEG